MATGMEATIEFQLQRRTSGLLVDAAERIPNTVRWQAGVSLESSGCAGLNVYDPNFCDYDALNYASFIEPGPPPAFEPFEILKQRYCTALDTDIITMNDRFLRDWEVMASEALAGRLEAELAARSHVVTTGPVSTSLVVASAEQALASTLHGGIGMVHMSPAALAMVSERLVRRGDDWFTPGGHVVVSDAGHLGLESPPLHSTPANTEWIYTSGPVKYGLSDPITTDSANEYLDRDVNNAWGRVRGVGIVAFDPCAASAIQYGFPGYTEGS